MKKLLILSAISVFTLSSFSTIPNNSDKKVVKLSLWNYKCKNGRTGSFWCDGCGQSSAMTIANSLCQ